MLGLHIDPDILYTAAINELNRFLLWRQLSEMQNLTIIIKLFSVSFCYSCKIIVMGFFILRTVRNISMLSIYPEIKFISA